VSTILLFSIDAIYGNPIERAMEPAEPLAKAAVMHCLGTLSNAWRSIRIDHGN